MLLSCVNTIVEKRMQQNQPLRKKNEKKRKWLILKGKKVKKNAFFPLHYQKTVVE